jgi:outer membrane receptor protein involved in Fe transport
VNSYLRILTAAALMLGLVGPFSMATSFAQAPATQTAIQPGVVNGSVHDSSGVPVANVRIDIRGPKNYSVSTDSQGNFSLGDVVPGIYSVTASKAGYQTATAPDLTVLGGETESVTVTMNAINFQSLRTISSVRASGRGTFNTTPAAVNTVSSQQIHEQGATQVMQVLDETPGIVASLPSSSANAATPGAITVPNIRGGLSFETSSLVDGHPVSVGTYGDYVTTFLNPFMIGNVEVIKGPGVAAPDVNYAIGGTVNFQTKDPTFLPAGFWQVGTDNYGGTTENLSFSNTIGKLGFVAAYSNDNLATKVQGYQAWIPFSGGPQTGVINYNPNTGTGTALGYNDTSNPVPGTASSVYNQYSLVGCCFPVQNVYNNQSELVKLRYKFTPATFLTFTYLGSQTWANQAANTGDITPSILSFNVPAGQSYTGALPNGGAFDAAYVRTGNDTEINNEPIFEGDFHTTVGNDTLLARYYAAGIDRLIHQGPESWTTPDIYNFQLYGYDSATKKLYNGGTYPIAVWDWYDQGEIDRVKGYSLEWDHPFGSDGQDLLTGTYDITNSTTISYGNGISGGPSAGKAFNSSNVKFSPSYSLPEGSKQLFGTFMLRANLRLSNQLNLQLANYLNSYQSTYPSANIPGGNCRNTMDGSQCIFATTSHTHEDGRVALEYRPTQALALRLSAGSAIAPPYLGLLNSIPGKITYTAPNAYATQSVNAGTLQPETAFGYDLGADFRLPDGVTTFSGDLYLTNLFNHFISQIYPTGQVCPAVDPVSGQPTNCPANTPLWYSSNVNLNNARFEGIELSLRRRPAAGFGYTLQGSLQRAYAYNLPPNFYCSFVPTASKPCIPKYYNTNLAIIEGQNFTGNAIGANGFSNTNIPYATGYGELNYHFRGGSYVLVGGTYFGHNNSLFEPAFIEMNAAVGYRFANGFELQLTGSNITNEYSNLWPNYGGGTPIPLANGFQSAATQANVLGPAVYSLNLSKYFGTGANPNQ